MLWSSSGASTSSSTQIGAGLVRNTAKMSASAVSACSPPERSDKVAGFLPGGLAMIPTPASSGSSFSISCNSANDTATTEIYPLSLHDVFDLGGRRIIKKKKTDGKQVRTTPSRTSTANEIG